MGPTLHGNPTPLTKALNAAENERRVANELDSRPSTKSATRSCKARNAPNPLAKFPIKSSVYAFTSSIPKPSTVGVASPRKDRASTAQPNRLQKPSARVGRGAAQLKQKALTTRDEERCSWLARRVASDDEAQLDGGTAVQDQAQELLDMPYLSDTESEDLPATTTLRNRRVKKFVRTLSRWRGHKAADRLATDPQATTAEHGDIPSAAGPESDMQRKLLENLSPSTHLVYGVARFPPSRSVAAPATFREEEWSHVPYGNSQFTLTMSFKCQNAHLMTPGLSRIRKTYPLARAAIFITLQDFQTRSPTSRF